MKTTQKKAESKPSVLILMPFSPDFEDVYKLGIKAACEAVGVHCERIDEQHFEGHILERIYNQIESADIIIAEMTGNNPNVYYETGYAHALDKRVILLVQQAEDIPFDLKHFVHIVYGESIVNLKTQLETKVRWYIENPRDTQGNDRRTEIYFCSRVERSRLSEFHSFCRKILGNRIATIERMDEWLQKNPNVLYLVYARKNFEFKQVNHIVGFFSIFPVTQEAKQLLSRNLLKGSEFTREHIAAKGQKPAAYYIGAMGGEGLRGKQQTLLMVMGYITSLIGKKNPLLFTRPVTQDGLRITNQYGFHPVLGYSEEKLEVIYVRDFSQTSL